MHQQNVKSPNFLLTPSLSNETVAKKKADVFTLFGVAEYDGLLVWHPELVPADHARAGRLHNVARPLLTARHRDNLHLALHSVLARNN